MEVHWRQVQRWVTNCFWSTPVPILCSELCLTQLSVLLPHKSRMAALGLIVYPTTIHPALTRLCWYIPTLLEATSPDSHRALCTRLDPNVMPLNWKTRLTFPPVCTHLPVDVLAHLTVPLLNDLSFAPLINSTLLPNLPSLPSDEIMIRAYCALKWQAPSLMMDQWRSLPLLSNYLYLLCLSPHPFMGLANFMAGYIDQMRSQKSYPAAHPSWFNAYDSQLCPLYGNEPETFSHVILHCSTKALAQGR